MGERTSIGVAAGARTRPKAGWRRKAPAAGAILLVSALAVGGAAFGQSVPSQVEPRAPQEQPQVPGTAPSPLEVPQLRLPGQAPPGAGQLRFTLSDIEVEGATVYPSDEIRAFYADRVGREMTLQEVFDIAAAIETRYHDDGYFLTRVAVPPQRIEEGRVRLQVVEGYISEVTVSGDVGPVRDLIERYVDKITASRPARLEDVERYLLLANDLPGITAQGVLQGGSAADGATKLVVNAERDWFSGYARVDNRESHFTGPWRAVVAPGFNSFTQFGERVQATGLLAIDEFELGYVGLSAEGRVGSEGLKIGASVSYDLSEPGTFTDPNGDPFDIETRTQRASFFASYPVIRSRETNLWVSGGFDASNVDVDFDFGPFAAIDRDRIRDRLRVLWAGLQVDHRDSLGGANLLSVRVRQGLDIFGSTDGDDLRSSRADADGTFTSLQFNLARRQRILDTLNLYVGGKAQFSFEPLLADEECSVGGESYGRGYDASEIADDHCLAGTVELQYNPEWRPDFLKDYIASYQVYGFYDVGKVWPENGDFDDGGALQSAGIGLRTSITDWLRLEFEVAKPLTRERGSDDNDRRMPRFYFGTVAQF